MPDFGFYTELYGGRGCDEEAFGALARRAARQMNRYERLYTVSYPAPDSRRLAVCAVAEQMWLTEAAAGLDGSSTPAATRLRQVATGSVASRYDGCSAEELRKSAAARYYEAARQYADIYRGGGPGAGP